MIQQVELTQPVLQYIHDFSLRDTAILRELRQETLQLPEKNMQISPEQGQFMHLLTKMIGARKTLEVGVFTGYSTLCTALALPPDGRVVACDFNKNWLSIAQRYWDKSGVQHKIDVRFGDARETLKALIDSPSTVGTFDLAFIDADKESYDFYYESALKLIRKGGVILLDNTLWSGWVADPSISDPETNSLRKINAKLLNDDRVDISLLPFADGLTLALKR